MLPQEVIIAKRDGGELPASEIAGFIEGLTSGDITEGQAAAFAMAVFFRGMSRAERVALTEAMRDSGEVLKWSLPGPVLDKHSTGGIGDNVSLMLAPALAACGAYVPMISGRGLGHTGGTLDKLDSIPGYNTAPGEEALRDVVRRVGCAIIGQTGEIAPADKRLYAIRDITGTVESIDLIVASILSKKLAAGLHGLVLDVKAGTGAFMGSVDAARDLAKALVSVANGAGCRTSALLTDMNEPLASCAGNAIETANAVAFLRGDEIDERLWDVTVALGGELLKGAGLGEEDDIAAAFQSGRAAEIFGRMVSELGGPADFMDSADKYLAKAPVVEEIYGETGFVSGWDGRALGNAVVELGGGRRRAPDPIDYSVGLDWIAGIGESVDEGRPLCRIHARDTATLEAAKARVLGAARVSDAAPDDTPLIIERIGERDTG